MNRSISGAVLYADKQDKRLLLYAEMKLPGEAWLEFNIKDDTLHQIATFCPLGVWGRITAVQHAAVPRLHFQGHAQRDC
ncbi:MAG: hypothetical protein U5K69_13440 [Balneolaceae bacterium]|nr:hypothetical protein [Balneolaceae bacterium]